MEYVMKAKQLYDHHFAFSRLSENHNSIFFFSKQNKRLDDNMFHNKLVVTKRFPFIIFEYL